MSSGNIELRQSLSRQAGKKSCRIPRNGHDHAWDRGSTDREGGFSRWGYVRRAAAKSRANPDVVAHAGRDFSGLGRAPRCFLARRAAHRHLASQHHAFVGDACGVPISGQTVMVAMIIFTAIFLLPALRGWGLKIRHDQWNRAGFAAALVYVALTFFAHRAALERIHKFAELDHLQVKSIGALPLPPSLWHWDGLVRSQRGVYELRMDLSDRSASDADLLAREHRYYPDAPPNSDIEAAGRLPEVQKVLWFARFPVTRFHKEGDEAIVEISDVRFSRSSTGRPPAFTYRVRFGADGNVVSQGWVTR